MSLLRFAKDRRVTRTHAQDRRTLQHLGHKRRHSLELTVAGSHSGEDAVEDGDLSLLGGDEAPNLSHEGRHADLTDVRRLST